MDFIFLHEKKEKNCTALYFSKFGTKYLKWLVIDTSTLISMWDRVVLVNISTTRAKIWGENTYFVSK